MRFSIGASLGPIRVSQPIGMGRNNSRPGYFAQFETCTVNHRSADTRSRCGKKHPPTEYRAANAQTAPTGAIKEAYDKYRRGIRSAEVCELVREKHSNEAAAAFSLAVLPGAVALITASQGYAHSEWCLGPALFALICMAGVVWHIVALARVKAVR